MASVFKTIGSDDITKTKTLIHEAIPLTGSLLSGTYGSAPYAALGSERNIKNFSHGMFQSVFDYPYLSSSANHLFDITFGYSSRSAFSASSGRIQQDKKINIYNQMAQVLVGHDLTGGIKEFTWGPNGEVMRECFFINFSRLLTKDEIKKGSFELQLGTASYGEVGKGGHSSGTDGADRQYAFGDGDSQGYVVIKRPATTLQGMDEYYTDSPAGEYAILSGSNLKRAGLIYYQAGVVVLTASVMRHPSGSTPNLNTSDYANQAPSNTIPAGYGEMSSSVHDGTGHRTTLAVMTGSAISASCNDLRHRIKKIDFNNTTELHSTIYFVRANHNEFNYSSNPTYMSESKIRVKTATTDSPVSYITTVGLYSADNELLAVAKLSEPLKKTPETDLTMRVRLDY